jgi:alpha-tubulin suppressor-like RCC1 family protein
MSKSLHGLLWRCGSCHCCTLRNDFSAVMSNMMNPPRSKKFLSTKSPSSSSSSSSFALEWQRRGNKAYYVLNREIAAATKQANTLFADRTDDKLLDTTNLLANEYVRQTTVLDQLYRNEGSLLGMGQDENFQLGFFSPDDEVDDKSRIPPSFIETGQLMRQISAGGIHSVALSTHHVPYTWGTNDLGQLGRLVEEETHQVRPMPVTGFQRRDTGAVEDGQIVQIAAGDMHTLFLSGSGAVYQCGGYRDDAYKVFSDEGEDGKIKGSNKLPVHVHQMPGEARAIFAGDAMNAALLMDHSLVTWGE